MIRSVFDMKIGHRYCYSCGADTSKVSITAGYGVVCPVCELWWKLEKEGFE